MAVRLYFIAMLPDLHHFSKQAFALWRSLDSNTISTVILLVVVILIRWTVLVWIERHTDMPHDLVVRWRQRVRYISLLFVIVALLVIWAPELRAFAVSIVAVSAALVIGLKEILNSVIGGFIRGNVEGSRLGGRITINGIRGDIVSNDILSTSLLEVNENGLRTGRMIVVPNSVFMTNAATTEFFMDRKYMLMWVSIPMNRQDNWQGMEEHLLTVGRSVCAPYINDAIKYFERFNRKFGLNIPAPDPRVFIEWTDPDKIHMRLRMAVPVMEQSVKRQDVLRQALAFDLTTADAPPRFEATQAFHETQ